MITEAKDAPFYPYETPLEPGFRFERRLVCVLDLLALLLLTSHVTPTPGDQSHRAVSRAPE